MRVDLTDMRVFVTVVENGSLTRGARMLHLSLAAVSERIRDMESSLGTPLLERNSRGVVPTAAGEALIRNSRLVLVQVERLHGELRNHATGAKGRVKLLSNTGALAAFLPDLLCKFLTAHPDFSIDLLERPSVDIVRAIEDRRAELGFVSDIADFGSLSKRFIAIDRLVVVAGKEHRMAKQSGAKFVDITDEPFIGVSDAALESYIAERASRIGRQINYRIQLRSVEDVAMFVAAGTGIAILPESSAVALSGRPLVLLQLMEPWASRQLYLCARDFSSLTPHADLLAQELLQGRSVCE
ncbi:MAG TPA: LysR family transcriptional regulator [Burkholderiales bacterium]|nr:LysR family transcriptional regulator [Burkholderiales bacterium]